MLRYLLKWITYRTIKAGLLLDFFVKRLAYRFSRFFFYYFTIFFGDKFILEHFFSNFSMFLQLVSNKLKVINRTSFLNFLKVSFHIILYFALLAFIIFVL